MFLAAVCPPAPLLINGLAPRLAAAQHGFVGAVRRLIADLSAADRIVVLAAHRDATRTSVIEPGAPAGANPFARSDIAIVPPRSLPGSVDIDDGPVGDGPVIDDDSTRLATGTIVAAHLLAVAGIEAPTTAVQVPVDLAADDITAAARDLVAGHRTALLVMAGGAAAHGVDAPAGDDERAPDFDRALGAALATGDPHELAATCAELAELGAELRCDELPLLAAVAELTAENGRADSELLHYSAPLGIGYPVARWRWPITGAAS